MSISKKSVLGSLILRSIGLIGLLFSLAKVVKAEATCAFRNCHVVNDATGKADGDDRNLVLTVNESTCAETKLPYTGYFKKGSGTNGTDNLYIACPDTPSGTPIVAPSGATTDFTEN